MKVLLQLQESQELKVCHKGALMRMGKKSENLEQEFKKYNDAVGIIWFWAVYGISVQSYKVHPDMGQQQ